MVVVIAPLDSSTTENYSRMAEMISPFNKMLTLPEVIGRWDLETAGGLARLGQEITRQSAMIGYLNAFGLFTAACAATLPLIMMMNKRSTQ